MEAPYLDSLGSYVGQIGAGLYKRFLDTVLNRGEDEGECFVISRADFSASS